MKEGIVTLLVCCYNHENFVKDCLYSIVNQSYKQVQLILCDDCSTDSSWEKVKQMEQLLVEKLEQVILIRNEKNKGLVDSLNNIMDYAKGEYIKILASDDMLLPEYLQKCVEYMNKDTSLDMMVTNGYVVGEESTINKVDIKREFYKEKQDFDTLDIFNRLFWENKILAPSVLLRSTVYTLCGKYDNTIAIEDWPYWLELTSRKKAHIGYIHEPLIYYRKNTNSATSLNGPKLEKSRRRIYEAEKAVIDKYGPKVSKRHYAEKRLSHMKQELLIAEEKGLKEWENEIRQEIMHFDMILNCNLRTIVSYYLNRTKW